MRPLRRLFNHVTAHWDQARGATTPTAQRDSPQLPLEFKMKSEPTHAAKCTRAAHTVRPAAVPAQQSFATLRNEPATHRHAVCRQQIKAARLRGASRETQNTHRYVPDGISPQAWAKMQADKKKNAAENKKKYPKGAAQVVGVGEYLEDLAKKQTFFKDRAGNAKVSATGHKWAKVKFGDFTKESYDEWRKKGGKKLPNQMY